MFYMLSEIMTRLYLTSRLIRIKWWVNSFVFKQYIASGMVIGEIRPIEFEFLGRYMQWLPTFSIYLVHNCSWGRVKMNCISKLYFAGSVFDFHQNRWIYTRDEKWVPITSIIIISRCTADVYVQDFSKYLVVLLSSKGHCSILVQCSKPKQSYQKFKIENFNIDLT